MCSSDLGRCWHGLALNIAPDLAGFAGINPCGYEGLAVTSLQRLGVDVSLEQAGSLLADALCRAFYGTPAPAIISAMPTGLASP